MTDEKKLDYMLNSMKNKTDKPAYLKLYIAVLDEVSDFMVPTLVAHSILGAHLEFCDSPIDAFHNRSGSIYTEWLKDSFRKCVIKVNRKEFENIIKLNNKIYLGHENTTLGGETSCLIPYPVMSDNIPNVLQYAKLWKPSNSTIIYFDMDGVLADFNTRYIKYSYIKGNYPSLYDFSKLPKEEKDAIKEELFTYDFFRYMQPLFKGIELLKYYQKNYPNVVILSAIGSSSHSDEIERAKREWLEEHIGNITAHFVNKTEDKFNITKLYPSFSNHLLVDDRTKAVDPWIAKGGIGVLYGE